jgi:hypothetical protein
MRGLPRRRACARRQASPTRDVNHMVNRNMPGAALLRVPNGAAAISMPPMHRLWPDLASAPETAEILGILSQRVHVLAAQIKRFPRPAYELRTGKVWVRAAIEKCNDE